MCGPYWSQWDRADLDSWMGRDYSGSEGEVDVESEESSEPHDCGNCMECLGMSWGDFM